MKSASVAVLIGLIILLSAIFIFAIVILLYRLVSKFFAKVGTWGRLAEKYPAETEPVEILFRKQTIRVGAVRYRQCVAVALLPQGIYLATKLPGHASVRIPWREFHRIGKTRIYSRPATEWSIGNPEVSRIAFPLPLAEKLKSYLGEINL